METCPNRLRYVLLVRVPRDVEVVIEDTFLNLPGATKPVMGYHVTLLGPFCIEPEEMAESLQVVETLCARVAPFHLRISGLGAFRTPNSNAVYLQVDGADILKTLHDALVVALGPRITIIGEAQRTQETYEPHVTLGLDLSDHELNEFLAQASRRSFDQSFEVHCIALVRQENSGPWQYAGDYALATGDPSTACRNVHTLH